MNPVIGIDLGTTNTVVAHADAGRAVTLADTNGEKLIPSVVSFHPNGQVLAGQLARERRLVDAANTVYSVKRLIGRTWSSEEVRRARARFPFELREGPGQGVLVYARGQTYTLPEISAHVLRKAKAVAEAGLGGPVEKAVITVPASFNDLQRAATKVAARVAGLEALRILNEPTAAALAYGYTNATAQKIVVYDFGGGTFDLTLLDLSGNVFEVLSTSGDSFLGGDDIDAAIVERMAEAFLRAHRIDVRTDPQALERLRSDAERMKITLSALPSATVDVQIPAMGPGGTDLSLSFSMSRADLEALIAPLVDRSLEVCQQALGTARLSTGDFEQVLLVGGSTRIPLIKRRVSEFFGKDPLQHRHPEEVVALGAAIQAMALTSADRRRGPEAARDPRRPSTLGGLGEQAADARNRTEQDPRAKTNPGVAPAEVIRTRPGVSAPEGAASAPNPMTTRGVAPAPGDRDLLPVAVNPGAGPKRDGITTESQSGHAPSTADFGRNTPAFGMSASRARGAMSEQSSTDLGWDDASNDDVAGLPLISTGTLPSVKRDPSVTGVRAPGYPTQPSVGVEAQQAIAALQMPGAGPAQGPQVRRPTPPPMPQPAPIASPTVPLMRAPSVPAAPAVQPRQQPMFPTRTSPQAPPPREDQSVMDMLPLIETGTPSVSSEVPPMAPPQPVQRAAPPPQPPPQPVQPARRIPSTSEMRAPRRAPSFPDLTPLETVPQAAPPPHPAPAPPPPAPPPPPAAAFAATAPSVPTAPYVPTAPPATVFAATAPSVGGAGTFVPSAAAPMQLPSFPPPPPEPAPAAPAIPPYSRDRGPNQTQVIAAVTMPQTPAPVAASPPASGPGSIGLSNMSIPGARWTQGLQGSSPALSGFTGPAPVSGGIEVLIAPLCIETVGGFCDVFIPRNTQIPCEKTEVFVTSSNNQVAAKIRISQGNSSRFSENALIGEVTLNGLGPTPRGETHVSLSISLERDGVLTMRARDANGGPEVAHQVTLPRSASA